MNPTIKTIWGLAKCKELALSDDDLHALVIAHTGKESIKTLSDREIEIVIGVLLHMKESSYKAGRREKRVSGNIGTVNQRKKVYKLAQELGWDKPARINGMCKRMFAVSCVEWLDYQQCSRLIEALKAMLARSAAGGGNE